MKSMTKKDFEISWFSGTGAGGQHRNKTQNCCRITHKESGLSATGQNSRSRVSNQNDAFRALARKLVAYYSQDESTRNFSQVIVRTYHFERNVVTDGDITKTPENVMNGKIDDFLKNRTRTVRKTGRC